MNTLSVAARSTSSVLATSRPMVPMGQGSMGQGSMKSVSSRTAAAPVKRSSMPATGSAATAGHPLVLGYVAAHWLPAWNSLSDPVWEIDSLQWFSYVASTAEIVTALAIAVLGSAIVRQRGLAALATQNPRNTRSTATS